MQYLSKQPLKLLRRASIEKQKINKRLDHYTQDFTELRALAAYQQESVRLGIQKNKHNNDNFRKLEEQDRRRKDDILDKIEKRTAESMINRQKLVDIRHQEAKKFNEHAKKILEKHNDDDLAKQKTEEQEALRMRRERIKQIEEKEKNKINFKKQRRSYDQAIQKIRKRDRLIEEFALDTSDKLDNSFKRNYKKVNPEMEELRMDKLKKYFKVLQEQKILLGLRTNRCMQHHCSNLEAGDEMNQFKRTHWEALSKTIEKLNKSNSERVKLNKQHLDDEQRIVPEKCDHRMNQTFTGDKSGKSSKNSSFMITSKTWRSEGKNKRDYMKTIQENRNSEIMSKHLSTTFKNRGQLKINTKFLDLSRKASFNAKEFL